MAEKNLRGSHVEFTMNDRVVRGIVITRIRGTRWMIQSPDLPNRITLDRSAFTITEAPVRKARSPIEAMIDKACGL